MGWSARMGWQSRGTDCGRLSWWKINRISFSRPFDSVHLLCSISVVRLRRSSWTSAIEYPDAANNKGGQEARRLGNGRDRRHRNRSTELYSSFSYWYRERRVVSVLRDSQPCNNTNRTQIELNNTFIIAGCINIHHPIILISECCTWHRIGETRIGIKDRRVCLSSIYGMLYSRTTRKKCVRVSIISELIVEKGCCIRIVNLHKSIRNKILFRGP